MRISQMVMALSVGFALACGADAGPPQAPFEGEWRVINSEGVENGQLLLIEKEQITLTTLGKPTPQPAVYTMDGENVNAEYLGWNYTLKMGEDDKHASFKGVDGGGVQFDLIRD